MWFPVCLQLYGGRTGVEGPGLSRMQRALFGLGDVLLPYAWAKASKAAMESEWAARWVGGSLAGRFGGPLQDALGGGGE